MTKREIKFRAYHKKEKKMYEVSRLEFLTLSENVGCVGRFNDANDEDVVLMQYTGLKDKNGKEMYFDDIVRLKDSDDVWQVVKDDFGVPLFVANNHINNKKAYRSVDFEDFFMNFGRHDFEIIGNIYESPELLKEKQ